MTGVGKEGGAGRGAGKGEGEGMRAQLERGGKSRENEAGARAFLSSRPSPSSFPVKLSAESKSECASIATLMRTGPCSSLQDATQAHTADILAMACPALLAFQAQMPLASEACCPQMRQFVTMGCACDEDVAELVQLGGGTAADLAAALKMAQAGNCADAAHGGPIMDPCTNDIGCRGAV